MPKDQTLIVEAVELQLLQIAHTHATHALPCSLTSSGGWMLVAGKGPGEDEANGAAARPVVADR